MSDTRRRAATLIIVLWAITLLAMIAGGISFVERHDIALANIDRDRLVARWCARAGVERAIADLMDDSLLMDTEQDLWSNNEEEYKDVQVGGGTFSLIQDRYELAPLEWYGVNDESAKLNVNVAAREQLMKLPKMTAAIAAAIIDWRDKDENPEPDGIERGYYGGLAHPYSIRNGPMRTVRELLLVRGVTPELFYGEDTNVNGRLDPNENDGPASDPPDNADSRLDRGWYAYLTIYSFEKNEDAIGLKRLNLNKTDAGMLASQLQLESWAAESIEKRRGEREFKHLVELLDVPLDPSVTRGSPNDDLNVRGDEEKNRPVTKRILQRIMDGLTLSDEEVVSGRVNINTAPREVLKTLMDDDIAKAVVRARDGGTLFSSPADLLDVTGMTGEKFGDLENYITVRSSVFRILSRGQAEGGFARETVECVVERSGQVPQVLYWRESAP